MSNPNEETYDSLEDRPLEYFLIHLLQHDEWNRIARTYFCDENGVDLVHRVPKEPYIDIFWCKEWNNFAKELSDWFGVSHNFHYDPYDVEENDFFKDIIPKRLEEFKNIQPFTEAEFYEFCKQEHKKILTNNEIVSNIKWQQPEYSFDRLYKKIKDKIIKYDDKKTLTFKNIKFYKIYFSKKKIIPFFIEFENCDLEYVSFIDIYYKNISFFNCKINEFKLWASLELTTHHQFGLFHNCELGTVELLTSHLRNICEYEHDIYFHINNGIQINHCFFSNDLSFENYKIKGDVLIVNTHIKGNFIFRPNSFDGKFTIEGKISENLLDFSGIRVDGSTEFNGTTFPKDFSITSNNKRKRLKFIQRVILDNCIFKGNVKIEGIFFVKGISLQYAEFEKKFFGSGITTLPKSNENVIDLNSTSIDFQGAKFKGICEIKPRYLKPMGSYFHKIIFKNAIFEDNCIFYEIEGNPIIIEYLDCTSAHFKKDFILCEHGGRVFEENGRTKQPTSNTLIHEAVFRGAKFDCTLDMSFVEFEFLPDFRAIECKGEVLFGHETKIKDFWKKITSHKIMEKQSFLDSASLIISPTLKWGALRKLASKHNNFEYEAFFFNKEMQAKIQESSGLIKWLIVLYGFLSCYGMNIKRPLIGMGIIFGAFFFINLSIIMQHAFLAYILAGFFIAILLQFIKQVSQDPVKSISIQMITPCLISITTILCFVLLSSSILINSSQILPTHSETYSVTGIEENVHNLKISQHKEISFVGKAFENTLDASFSFLSLKPKSEDTGATFKLFRYLQALMTLILTFLTALGIRNILRFRGGGGS